jgi:E3 ubiquitin-protein ligase DOA10
MKIAGLHEMAYWLSWLCLQMLFVVGPLVLSSCSIYLVLGSELQTPFLAFFLLNVGYVFASIMFSFFIPVIFTSVQLSSIIATIWFTILALVSTFLVDSSFAVQMAASFIAPMGFYCALMKVFINEATSSPWTEVWFSSEEMTIGNSAAILFIDAFIYMFLVWYVMHPSNLLHNFGSGCRSKI